MLLNDIMNKPINNAHEMDIKTTAKMVPSDIVFEEG